MKRTEKKTKTPGIYKEFVWDSGLGKYISSGRYRAMALVKDPLTGVKKKKSSIFSSFLEAKDFRVKVLEGGVTSSMTHTFKQVESEGSYKMLNLISDWKEINYFQMEPVTRETYNKQLRLINKLASRDVSSFSIETIDQLVKDWMASEDAQAARRESFKKELKLLGQLFRFYQQRKDPTFMMPILDMHFKKCVIKKKARNASRYKYLKESELVLFLNELKKVTNKNYYYLAICQYFLGLRIGEACGLHWEGLDQENMTWKIEKVISWSGDQKGRIKPLPKNDEIREQPFTHIFLHQMMEFQKFSGGFESGLVFQRKGGLPLRRNSIVRAYNVAFKNCGLGHLGGTHTLRRTAGTLGNSKTGDYAASSHFLGHKDVKMGNLYIGRDGWKDKHVNALAEVFEEGFGRSEVAKLRLVNE